MSLFLEPTGEGNEKEWKVYWVQKKHNHGYLHATTCYGATRKDAFRNLENYTTGCLNCHAFYKTTRAPEFHEDGTITFNGDHYTRAYRNMLW